MVKSHFSARRSKLEDSSPSLFLVSEWFQEPYEIEFFKKSWSSTTHKNQIKKNDFRQNSSEMVQDWSRIVRNLKQIFKDISYP